MTQEQEETLIEYMADLVPMSENRDTDTYEIASNLFEQYYPDITQEFEARAVIACEFENESYTGNQFKTVPFEIFSLIDGKQLFLEPDNENNSVRLGLGIKGQFTRSEYKYSLIIEAIEPAHRECREFARFVILDNETTDQIECTDHVSDVLDTLDKLLDKPRDNINTVLKRLRHEIRRNDTARALDYVKQLKQELKVLHITQLFPLKYTTISI
jgi:hypothetical protein